MTAITSATIAARQPLGGVARSAIVDVTFSSSYAAGGDTFTVAQMGMNKTILAIIPLGSAFGSATTAYVVRPDIANLKLMLYNSNGAAPNALLETGTGDQHLTTVRLLVIGDHPYV
jgi:hypothetical protein